MLEARMEVISSKESGNSSTKRFFNNTQVLGIVAMYYNVPCYKTAGSVHEYVAYYVTEHDTACP
jgi:hypothetical protein